VYVHRAHIEGNGSVGSVPLVANGDARWYFQYDLIPHKRNLVQGIDKVADLVERMLWIRRNSWKNHPDLATIKKTSPADVDIYLPSYMADRLAYVQSRINTLAQESLRHHGVPAARSARDT
jgi:hypothetical protein